MAEETQNPAEEHENDPQPHEGDQAQEMTEEGAPAPDSESPEVDEIDRELAIFQDLQRLQADFVNYRARVERDRGAERQLAVADTIRAFLPALDDLARAEAHGDLEEGTPMAAIAQKLRAAGEKFGLKAFGEKGEKFDPELHDALVQNPNPEVTEAQIADVIESGYLLGERMLRPAKVAVFVPSE
jgi:molecular chaperone GrpE